MGEETTVGMQSKLSFEMPFEKFQEYLGCSSEKLKDHIAKQLSKVDIPAGWANYGKLRELDHTVAASVLEKILEPTPELYDRVLKVVCRYESIQPLSKSQNCLKRDKITKEARVVLSECGLLECLDV